MCGRVPRGVHNLAPGSLEHKLAPLLKIFFKKSTFLRICSWFLCNCPRYRRTAVLTIWSQPPCVHRWGASSALPTTWARAGILRSSTEGRGAPTWPRRQLGKVGSGPGSSSHYTPGTPPVVMVTNAPDTAHCPLGAKLSLVEISCCRLSQKTQDLIWDLKKKKKNIHVSFMV